MIGFEFRTTCENLLAFRHTLDDLSVRHGYTVGHGGQTSVVKLCEGGEVNFEFAVHQKGLVPVEYVVHGFCETYPAGPGLHKAAIELLDELGLSIGRDIQVTDSTGYYDDRDFGKLRREHFDGVLQKDIEKDFGSEKTLTQGDTWGWPKDYYYPQRIPGTIVTGLGRFDARCVQEQLASDGIEAVASNFFIWYHEGKDALFYRNQGLAALWIHCYFMPSARSDGDEVTNDFIVVNLEKAAALDPTLPFPKRAYLEVCCLHDHQPIPVTALTDYESDYAIGYRRDWIDFNYGSLFFSVPGKNIAEAEKGTVTFRDLDGDNWHSIRVMPNLRSEVSEELLSLSDPEDPSLRQVEVGEIPGGRYQLLELLPEMMIDGQVCCICQCRVLTQGQYTAINIASFPKEETLSYARQIVAHLKDPRIWNN